MSTFTPAQILSYQASSCFRFVCIISYIIWLHLVCKLPLNFSDNNTRYVYLLSCPLLLNCISCFIETLLPDIAAAHFVLDTLFGIFFYVASGWHPRFFYGRQLEKTLTRIEKAWKLKLSWMLVVIASPLTCTSLVFDNLYLKYGSWDVVVGNVPWKRSDGMRLSSTGVLVTIISSVIIIFYQLHLFYIVVSHLRLDHQKKRVLRLIFISYMISVSGNSLLGLGMIINNFLLAAWLAIFNDIGVIVAPLLPVFVNRFPKLEKLMMIGIGKPTPANTEASKGNVKSFATSGGDLPTKPTLTNA